MRTSLGWRPAERKDNSLLRQLLRRLLGRRRWYPSLGAAGPARETLIRVHDGLLSLVGATADRMEVVPLDDEAFVFVGEPPRRFRLFRVEGAEVTPEAEIPATTDNSASARLCKALAQAYERSGAEQRYRVRVAGRGIVVTVSDAFAKELRIILHRGAVG